MKTVGRAEEESSSAKFQLRTHKVDKESHHIDPTNWFGILIPQSLKSAKEQYEKAIELIVESANVRENIVRNCNTIEKLRSIKSAFDNVEE